MFSGNNSAVAGARLWLLETITAPALAAASRAGVRFLWVLLTDPDLAPELMARVKTAVGLVPGSRVVPIRSRDPHTSIRLDPARVVELACAGEGGSRASPSPSRVGGPCPWLHPAEEPFAFALHTRLDADDAVSIPGLQQLQQVAAQGYETGALPALWADERSRMGFPLRRVMCWWEENRWYPPPVHFGDRVCNSTTSNCSGTVRPDKEKPDPRAPGPICNTAGLTVLYPWGAPGGAAHSLHHRRDTALMEPTRKGTKRKLDAMGFGPGKHVKKVPFDVGGTRRAVPQNVFVKFMPKAQAPLRARTTLSNSMSGISRRGSHKQDKRGSSGQEHVEQQHDALTSTVPGWVLSIEQMRRLYGLDLSGFQRIGRLLQAHSQTLAAGMLKSMCKTQGWSCNKHALDKLRAIAKQSPVPPS